MFYTNKQKLIKMNVIELQKEIEIIDRLRYEHDYRILNEDLYYNSNQYLQMSVIIESKKLRLIEKITKL